MDWDDVCWNPHESSFRQGQEEGLEAGSIAGYRDGQALGRTKGLEFGMELGFINGFLNVVEQQESIDKSDRIQRSVEKLRKVLEDECLQPNEIFEHHHHQHHQQQQQQQQNNQDDSEDPSKLDVLAKMQRVRARFKVLTVQLGIPKFSLKGVMDDAANSGAVPADPATVDNEW
eukprot:scaffold7017_cov134-Cylindrotheca_fusiformis.AAC.25